MGDENPIRTLGDYSKPSHEGHRNTIGLPVRNNVVPLRSDAIRLVQNKCSFHGLRSEDPNQHLKDLLKLVDSLDLDGDNRERTCMRRVFRVEYNRTNGIDKRCQVLISSDIKVVSSGWSFVSAIHGQMIYPVTSSTLDSARYYVMQGASLTQGMISIIPIGGSINPKGFLPSILLLVVIIVMVVIVIVIVIDDLSFILKLSFVIIGVPVGPVFLLGLLVFAIVAACASRARVTLSATTCRGYGMIHNDEDGDNDAYGDDGDNNVREISWYYETTRCHPKYPSYLFGDELGFP
ncbi:hypothetical protein Tco_1121529 [Tanacetum coccineum]|uniref:Zinc finger, CCHC-type n=1 Tax=Tanacetum coccineum TaxID=301880 RepID=A0ABQ5J1N0_9ASTR